MKKILPILILFTSIAVAEESTCYGTTSDGRLENGIKLPASGTNFEGYSSIARAAGRTYVHSHVSEIILAAYKISKPQIPIKYLNMPKRVLKREGSLNLTKLTEMACL